MTKLGKKLFAATLCICLIVQNLGMNKLALADEAAATEPESGPHGSGSYQLNEVADDYRFYTEYYVGANSGRKYTTAGVERRTTIQVYARAGEFILFGSSVADSEIDENNVWKKTVTGTDIVITTPFGTKVCADVLAPGSFDKDGNKRPKGLGYIANPTQEKYGPMVNHADEVDAEGKYYVPLTYEVPVTGVYSFEFHSKTGTNDGTTPSPVKASATNWNQKNTTVAAWDVTVLGRNSTDVTKWEVKTGRAWAKYLALSTGAAGSTKSDLNVHVLSHDGYVYKVDFEKAVPFGFIFFANNTGFMSLSSDDSGHSIKTPIYHSFYDSTNDLDNMSNENVILHKPNEDDTPTEETYKIFFNRPSDDLEEIGIKTNPVGSVTISDLKFEGIDENLALSGQGGIFSFVASEEAVISITLDLRKAIYESEHTMGEYTGSGMISLTAQAVKGLNHFYWNGQDTDGVIIPAGIYGDQNVVIATEVKRGELHFPVIDMEGLYGGLHIERLNGDGLETEADREKNAYNIYYNNSPLAYGTIEGINATKKVVGNYNILSDGTKSYIISSTLGGPKFFTGDVSSITTLKKDDKEYLSNRLFGTDYASLSKSQKEIIDAEFGREQDTFHFEAVDSRTTTMTFGSSENSGGGNQAGIDAWTYYSQGINADVISFAVLGTENQGIVRGKIFYDADKSSAYETGAGASDYPLQNVKVRLIDEDGNPLVHPALLPCFDETGHFVYDEDGNVKHELKNITYDTTTDINGVYRFTGVPYKSSGSVSYYIQVLLSDTQSEVLRYTCTTSEEVKVKLRDTTSSPAVPFHNNSINGDVYGADGNRLESVSSTSKVYGYKYKRDAESNETVFDKGNALNTQSITFSASSPLEHGVRVEEFKAIGYSTTVPSAHQRDYKLVKVWGTDSQGNETHNISDGLTVELWVWNDNEV